MKGRATSNKEMSEMTEKHDSAAWETVSGWMWGCRTCLVRGRAYSEVDAEQKRAEHDDGPIPWWVPRIRRSND